MLNSPGKMSIKPLSAIFLSAFLSVGATAGGWAITKKLAGNVAGVSFLYLGIPVVIGILVFQVVLFMRIKDRVYYLVMFNIFAVFGVVWMMLCLVLPLFWMDSIGISVKLLTIWFSIVLFYLNIARGMCTFRLRWEDIGEKLLLEYYKSDRGIIEWAGIVNSLKLSLSIYVPGIPKKFEPILSALLVMSMLAGLSVRKIFPEFSVFAWGIPAIICIATILQMTGCIFGQLSILRKLEKREGKTIRSGA